MIVQQILSNGSSDGHSLIDNTFSNIPTTSSFLSNNNSTNLTDNSINKW